MIVNYLVNYEEDYDMKKNYVKPMILANDELAEGIYLASGDGDCWTISVSKDQADAGNGASTFRIQANHSTNLQHISSKTTMVISFNQTISSAVFEGFSASVSGNTVVLERQLLADSYMSGDNFNSMLRVVGEDGNTLQCTGATISCTKEVNVQGNGGDGN